MDFVVLILFLALYYLRPQEWLPALSLIHPIQLLSLLGFYAMLKQRYYKQILRTPLDWLVLFYFIWTLIAGFQPLQTFSNIQAVLLFYFLAACVLNNTDRLKQFLGWWCVFVFIIAALAVVSEYGIDPLGSSELTDGPMKGRLVLNLSIFDNPNTLAHSIVPAIPLFYYVFYWKQVTKKAIALFLFVPLYCMYMTQSKGAFLCGFVTLLATLTFGRSKVMQVVIVFVAVAFGYSALFMLPRMHELASSKTDPAIQGRVAALTYGLDLMKTNFFGIGLGNFQSQFFHNGPLEKFDIIRLIPAKSVPTGKEGVFRTVDAKKIHVTEYRHFLKATHGAYNQNGAELGYVGLFLFVGILYCCVRTLLLVKSQDIDEERIRRALFAMVMAYACSSWMVDFTYRPTFFLMVAAISAFHRQLLKKHAAEFDPAPAQAPEQAPTRSRQPAQQPVPVWMPQPAPGRLMPGMPPVALATTGAMPPTPVFVPVGGTGMQMPDWKKRVTFEEKLRKKFKWTRLGFMDFAIIAVLTYCAIKYWEHLIATM